MILSTNGIDLYYEIEGEGEPLVLMHGFGGAGQNWKLIFAQPPEGFRCIIPDLRGQGNSTSSLAPFSFRQVALDIFALLDDLRVEKFKAIGLSGGGNALLHMATQQAERIDSMILVSATPYYPQQARTLMAEVTAENRTLSEWQQMRQWHKHGDDQIRAIWKQANAFKDSYDDMNFTPPLLSQIKARTLIVYGDRDPFYPVSIATEMYAAIARSSLWIVPDAGHGPIFGNMAPHFVEIALKFLKRGETAA